MPAVEQDFVLSFEDGVLTFTMAPSVNIGGQNLVFNMYKRAGSNTPIATASAGPGFSGVSGMTIVDSGQGIYSVNTFAAQVSGRDPGNYWFVTQRTDSGFVTNITAGYRSLSW